MPPVACGNDTDSRRWGFQPDVHQETTIGPALHWPPSSSLGIGGGRAIADGADTYSAGSHGHPNGGIEENIRLAIEGSQRISPGFRGSDDRESPGPRAMDPRIIVDSNSIGGSQGGGGAGGSRQGSPFTSPFDPSPHQNHPTDAMGASSFGASRISAGGSGHGPGGGGGGQTIVSQPRVPASAGVGGPPPRHRSIFDDPVRMGASADHSLGPSMGVESLGQGAEGGGGMGVMLGAGGMMGGPPGPNMSSMSLGPGGAGGAASGGVVGRTGGGQQGMVGGAPVSWHGQDQQPQQHQQQPQHQQHPQQHYRHQQQLRGQGSSSVAVDVGVGGRRIGPGAGGAAGSASGGGGAGAPWGTVSSNEDPMSMALASVPHGASSLPASAVPTVLERFPGFVRCVMDIAPEVVGWVIGRSGAHIKEMKHRSGCGMWVDQKDLKLYITGADMPRIHAAARLVGDLISKAPVNVNSAGVEDEVTSHMIECPPHLIGLLIGRGGSTIKRIKEESRANVVINQKMMKVIVSGIPQSVRLGVAMIEDVITFGRSAEHAGGIGQHPNFLDFPGSVAFGGMGVGDFDDGGQDRFTVRAGPPMSSGGRLAPPNPTPPFPGSGGGNLPAGGAFSSAATGPYDGVPPGHRQQHGASPTPMVQQGMVQQGMHSQQVGGGGDVGQPEMGYDGKDTDWSVFSATSAAVFNIGSEAAGQAQQQQQDHSSPSSDRPSMAHVEGHAQQQQQQHHHLSGLPPVSGGPRSAENSNASGGVDNATSHGSRPSSAGVLGVSGSASRAGSVSSGGTPPQAGRPVPVWNSMTAALRSEGGGARGAGSPAGGVSGPIAGAMPNMQRLSITSDDSGGAGQSLGQVNRQRERAGSPVGRPVDLAGFLGAMGLGEYARILTDNEIDLEAVQLMADSDFQDIGIPKGPRVKLLYALRTKRHPPKSGDLTVMRTFLTSLGLERYSKAFEEGEVDMGAVDVMEEADYAQLGVAKGPRLKMMNVLAKSFGGMNSGSVGGGSNAGSVSALSPEPRLSPHQHASASAFPVGNIALGVSATASGGGQHLPRQAGAPMTPPPGPRSRSRSAEEEISPDRYSGSATTGGGCPLLSPTAGVDDGSAAAAASLAVAGVGEAGAKGEVVRTASKGEGISGEETLVGGGAEIGLPPSWDERSLSPSSAVWVSSALGRGVDSVDGSGEGGACSS